MVWNWIVSVVELQSCSIQMPIFRSIASDADESSIINLKRSAERGNPVAQVALAKRFQTGQGVDRDSEKYVYWLGEAAERDYAEAQFLLGKELYNGHICEKNVSSALLYLEHAVKNSSIDAMCFILSNIEIQALKTFDLKKIENYLLERKEELSSNQLVQLSKYFEKYDLTQTLELTKLSYAKDTVKAEERTLLQVFPLLSLSEQMM